MERFLFVFIHLGLPLLVLLALLGIRPRSGLALVGNTVFYLLLLGFLYYWGQWPLALSLYFKYVVLGIMGLALWKFFRTGPRLKTWRPRGLWPWLRTGLILILALLLMPLTYQLIKGRSYEAEPVSLSFPLKGGTYYVANGGSNRTINNHFGAGSPSQQYALDINKIGSSGMATNALWATANAAHMIYGDSLFAPCKGRVVEVKYTVPDNEGASMDVSREDGMGNYVILDCDGLNVALVHLQYKSVAVVPGQRILTGAFLGQVGNSGFSQEPHLHLQAARYEADSTLLGVPMRFDGRELVRGDLVKN